MFDRDDLRWLAGRRPAPQGRFNAGQKLNTAITAALTLLFLCSGVLLWLGERDTRFRFASTVIPRACSRSRRPTSGSLVMIKAGDLASNSRWTSLIA